MSEGNVYPVRWKVFDWGFDVWINRRSALRARGSTLEEALEELSGVVCLATGDGEAVFELDPPASGNTSADHFVSLSGNGSWRLPGEFTVADCDCLYEGGICRSCCTGIGPRTHVPLPVKFFGDADLLFGGYRMPRLTLASEKFRSLLTRREQASVEWIPIEVRGKTRRRFFELRPTTLIKTVEDKKKPVSGWR